MTFDKKKNAQVAALGAMSKGNVQAGGGSSGRTYNESLGLVNGDFETGDLTGWTVSGNAPWVQTRVGSDGNWNTRFDESYGTYLVAGGVNSSAGIYQDIDISSFETETDVIYKVRSAIDANDPSNDSVEFTVALLDDSDVELGSVSKSVAYTNRNENQLAIEHISGAVTLRVSLDFTKAAAGSYINAAADAIAAVVDYGGEEPEGAKPALYWRFSAMDCDYDSSIAMVTLHLEDDEGATLVPASHTYSKSGSNSFTNFWDDDDTTHSTISNTSDFTLAMVFDDYVLPAAVEIQAVDNVTYAKRAPTSWVLQCSHDNVNWDDVLTVDTDTQFTTHEVRQYEIA